jgi:hypothetical protein
MSSCLLVAILLCAAQAHAQLTNPNFETAETINSGGIPSVLNDWEGNVSSVVGAENGIVPFDGNRMLRFLFAHAGQPGPGVGVGVRQLLEIQPGLTVTASAVFNRVPGDAQTDTEFHLEVEAYGGTLTSLNRLGVDTFRLLSDGNVLTWESATASLTMPPNTRYVGVHLLALENVFNDNSGEEFDGHYADAVTLAIVPEPSTVLLLSVGLAVALVKRRRANRARHPGAPDSALTG